MRPSLRLVIIGIRGACNARVRRSSGRFRDEILTLYRTNRAHSRSALGNYQAHRESREHSAFTQVASPDRRSTSLIGQK